MDVPDKNQGTKKIQNIAEGMKEALEQQFSSLKKKINNIGIGTWKPGLSLEARQRANDSEKTGEKLNFEQAKISVMEERMQQLESDIISLLADEGITTLSQAVFGKQWRSIRDTAEHMSLDKPENERLRKMFEDIRYLPESFRAHEEIMQGLRSTESDLMLFAGSPDMDQELVDVIQKQYSVTEGFWKLVTSAMEVFHEENDKNLANLERAGA